jgi:twinkle protein
VSEVVDAKLPCPHCASSDAYHVYDDGHGHCFSCGKTDKDAKRVDSAGGGSVPRIRAGLLHGACRALAKRRISEATCKRYGYQVGTFKNRPVQIAPYVSDTGEVVAQKVRFPDKDFTVLGDGKKLGKLLFGQHLFRSGGRRVIVTEGEIDCLSVAEAIGSWPVVSLPNGASGAYKALAANLEWLESFTEVVLWFDNDEPGRDAIEACVDLFAPGKVKVVRVTEKDANDLLLTQGVKAVTSATWEAKPYRPDGIVSLADVWDDVKEAPALGLTYPFRGLTEKLHGVHAGKLVTITAGTGAGKSEFTGEIGYHLAVTLGHTVGELRLEENTPRTARRYMGMYLNRRLHLPGVEASPQEIREAFDKTVGSGRMYAYSHFGSLDPDLLLSRVRYMVKALGVRFILLDHLSIVVSGLEIDDERKAIDVVMTKLRSLVEETGATIFVVVHLRRMGNQNVGHEDGHEVSLAHLRGSQAIAQLSDTVLALERDQQAEDVNARNTSTIRVLKDRLTGDTGVACYLRYSKDTGRLTEVDAEDGVEALKAVADEF